MTCTRCLLQRWRIATFQSPICSVLQKRKSAVQGWLTEYQQPGLYDFPCSWARLPPWPCISVLLLSLQSAQFFTVPACNLATVGARAFPTAASAIWNSLPVSHCFIAPLSLFKSLSLLPHLLLNHFSFSLCCYLFFNSAMSLLGSSLHKNVLK